MSCHQLLYHLDGQLSDVFATVRTQDVVFLGQEATTHQGHGTFCTVKAVMVPLAFVERDILADAQTCSLQESLTFILRIKWH